MGSMVMESHWLLSCPAAKRAQAGISLNLFCFDFAKLPEENHLHTASPPHTAVLPGATYPEAADAVATHQGRFSCFKLDLAIESLLRAKCKGYRQAGSLPDSNKNAYGLMT